MIRCYVWRSFLTRRYESATATRALQDLRDLRASIQDGSGVENVSAPVFDESLYPPPTDNVIAGARWPKTRDILGRGVLAMSLRAGGRGIADDAPATRSNLLHREYHHLFPNSLLLNVGGPPEEQSYRAVNCALVTWSTNRTISNLSPLQYLKDRVDQAHVGESAVRDRLRSHLVPWQELSTAGPYPEGTDPNRVAEDFERFTTARSQLLAAEASRLMRGEAGLPA